MDVSPSGGGIVKVNQDAPSLYPATATFTDGASVSLEAVPATGYRFNDWSGDIASSSNPTTITIDCNKKITANFSPVKPGWWLIGAAIAGLAIIGISIWLVARRRIS